MPPTDEAERAILIVRDAWLLDLGRRTYREVWDLQKMLVDRRAQDKIPDGLILVEHDPVATLGRRGTRGDVLDPGLEVVEVERGVEATRDGPERGVWVGGKKIASIGLAVQRNVTFHGFAHNVTTDLREFLKIRPCGHEGGIMTSMERVLGHPVDLEDVKASVIAHFQAVFGVTLRRVNVSELLPESPRGPRRRP